MTNIRKLSLGGIPALKGVVARMALNCLLLAVLCPAAGAFTFQEVFSVTNAPANPAGGLIQGGDGNFYGTSLAGGSNGLGSIFMVTPGGAVSVLASFNGPNGANPRGTLAADDAGNLYGVTYGGGGSNAGTIFKYAPGGSLTVLHDFAGSQGYNPYGGLVRGSDGNFYGTTENYGTIFSISPSGVFTTLSSYFGLTGGLLDYTLTQSADGSLYGVAGFKGYFDGNLLGSAGSHVDTNHGGVFFQVSTNGGVVTPLMEFAGINGDQPMGGAVQAEDGRFYGATFSGGAYGVGTLFCVATNPGVSLTNPATVLSGNTIFTKLLDFNNTNGAYPCAPLTLGPDGRIYGGTFAGGPQGQGTIFAIATNGAISILASLTGGNGAQIQGRLLSGADGYLYGTTRGGGTNGYGSVFRMDTNGVITPLASFPSPAMFQSLQGSLVQGVNGNFYGVATAAGSPGSTTLYQLTSSNDMMSSLVSLGAGVSNASRANLMQANDGNFYGTTYDGGPFNVGTVFQATSAGAVNAILSFDTTNGANPGAPLFQGADSLLYGTTVNGGNGFGTAFSLTTAGTQTMSTGFQGTNGANPVAPLMQGQDGGFYGTTFAGGDSNLGTVFRLTPDGSITSLASFWGTNGANPVAGLVQGSDGFLYGTTSAGGLSDPILSPFGWGTVFKIGTNGSLTTLAFFDGTNGGNPQAGLIPGPDGNFYGTALVGGPANAGTIFSVSTTGTLTTIYAFSGSDGSEPLAGLLLGSDGALYGTTSTGGSGGGGNIFRISQPAALQVSSAGGLVQIAWPAFDAGYHLETSADLGNLNGWVAVPDLLTTNGNQIVILQPAAPGSVFYRLKRP